MELKSQIPVHCLWVDLGGPGWLLGTSESGAVTDLFRNQLTSGNSGSWAPPEYWGLGGTRGE